MNIGCDQPLYIQPFDHRGSFQTKMFGWKGKLTREQTAEIAAAKYTRGNRSFQYAGGFVGWRVIYDSFKDAVTAGVSKEKAGILVDE